jgi:sterol desaturase/sphingolipid hydroxylase (fatty acid hydroxylase superfamily)
MDRAYLESQIAVISAVLLGLLLFYLLLELALLHFRRRRLRLKEARMSALGVLSGGVFGGALARLWAPLSVAFAAEAARTLGPLDSFGLSWPWWIYGWLVYEFWYWFQHWAAHKVRLLWCIHSPHHAPGSIHMLVGTNHHAFESVLYFPFFFGFMPALFGVDPLICVALNLVDTVWGSFLHVSDEIVPRGRYGVLERFLQTPAHHRVHHGKNVRYLDMNYNSITLFWDWVFGTLQPLRDDEPVEYGITRDVDTGSFWDVHVREFLLLAHDVRHAATWGDKFRFLAMPPGWAPGDASRTAANQKRAAAL